jgi:superfamily II DNA or RNA helicase
MSNPADRSPACDRASEANGLRLELAARDRAIADLQREVAQLRAQLAGPAAAAAPRGGAQPSLPLGDFAGVRPPAARGVLPYADQASPAEAKLALYRALFAGRDDVYARRWENPAEGTQGWAPAHAGNWRTPRERRAYLPLTDEVVRAHLEGRDTIGLYPLLRDDTCRLLACDFDKGTWRLDAAAYVEAVEAAGLPAALELSRSGRGAHVWIFFEEPVAASDARAMGAALLREAMAIRGELDLESYDRFFPSQDYLPDRSFGNLIALPLQGERRREHGTTVFVDPRSLEPYSDQFAFLSTLARMTAAEVHQVVASLRPVTVGPGARLHRSTLRAEPAPPATIQGELGGMLAIRRAGIPTGLYTTLKHLAMLPNPQFHKNQNLRLSNHATPRFIRCFEEDLEHLHLPRGLVEQAAALVAEAGSRLAVRDVRTEPSAIEFTFSGELHDEQAEAVERMAAHELGVLEAPPGTGKTVIACALIARHRAPALVLVDRKPLLQQWRERLRTHLGVEPGQIGAGRKHATRLVDIAMIQTVTRHEAPAALLDGYGLVVVDECHHVPAPTVERAIRDLTARRWLGLTATPDRPDGLGEIMVMQCGPIRHRMRGQASAFARALRIHPTALRADARTDGLTRGELLALVHAAVVEDEKRTAQICRDVAGAMREGRHCLVLSGRTEHVESLAEGLRAQGLDPLVLYGSMKPKERRVVHERLAGHEQILLVATDRYIGEGFDCPRLDSLFLTFPIAGTGRIVQYAGRILRDSPGKQRVEVHDYVDEEIPVLAAMHRKRLPAFRRLGFQ